MHDETDVYGVALVIKGFPKLDFSSLLVGEIIPYQIEHMQCTCTVHL